MKTTGARQRGRAVIAGCAILLVAALFAGGATGAPGKSQATAVSVTVGVLPIANTLPLDLGIKKGFFEQQGIEIKKITAQSGNDIMLGLANSNIDVGFAGWVPAMIARTSGIPISVVALSEVESTDQASNWQNILVKGSSSIRTPADLAGKTIAVNALKGVGEVMIRAALDKVGVDQSSIKLLALPFPAMRAALNSGQVDAIWTPEPFLSQAITIDGARDLFAPGPVLGKYFPIGGYFVRTDWVAKNEDVAARFRTAMNQSLEYSQNHGDEIRPPAGGVAQHPPADLDDRDESRAGPPARAVREEVRRHQLAAELHAVRPELDRRREDPSGDARQAVHHDPAGRQGRRIRQAGEVLDHRRGHLQHAGLPARRPRRDEGDRRQGDGEDDLERDAQEGKVRLQLDRQARRQEDAEGRLSDRDGAGPCTRPRPRVAHQAG